MRARRLLLVIAALLASNPVVGVAGVTKTPQMDARSEPTVTGPLIASNESYTGNRCRKEATEVDGEVTATIRYCRMFYRFEPGAETDAGRDYGVWWIQANLKGQNGWCISHATAKLDMQPGFEATNSVEVEEKLKERKDLVMTLTADADGTTSLAPGTVSNTLIAYKGTYRSQWKADSHIFKASWRGKTARKIALAGGIEGYWEAGTGPGIFEPSAGADVTKPC